MIRRCPSCGRDNRVPAQHLAHAGRCGECKARLAPSDAPLDVAPGAFDEIVAESPVPVLVDFWAPWCGPCRAVAPVLEQLQDELTGRLKIVKVNVDENGEIAGALGIRSIPTLIVFKEGKAVEGAVGALSKQQMLEFLEPHLESSAA